MPEFTFMCPRARPDENGAHEIHDVMSGHHDGSDRDDRVLFCARCGQAVPVADAIAATQRDPDGRGG
jgi:hypothetical protein